MAEKRFCWACMKPLSSASGACPHCGFDPERYHPESYILPPGTRIDNGKYMVGKMLGRGGFGITYIGLDIKLELRVAIKEYYPPNMAFRVGSSSELTWHSAASDKLSGIEAFLKEARKMARMYQIPGIVGVRDFFEENGTAYIVMDFVEGQTLKDHLLETGRMDAARCFRTLQPVMDSLEEAHQRGLIHRDIKPDNIMIDSNRQMWLLDMGAAKDLDSNTARGQSSNMVVTHGFSPLEQYASHGKIGAWTDVYAMSATAVYCMTGKTLPMATDRVLHPELQMLETLSPAVAAVMQKGLSIQPDGRWRTMEEFKRAFAEALKSDEDPDHIAEKNGEQAEQERIAQEEQAERERIAREREEQERIAREREEQERIAREREEQERIARERERNKRKTNRYMTVAVVALLLFALVGLWGMFRSNQRKSIEIARLQGAEESRRQAEEEARQKAEEEARQKAEEEARQKAEEGARQKAEEEARQKAEEEARRKAEAEEEARRKAEETSVEFNLMAFINDCDSQYFSMDTFQGFGRQECVYARNAIFAHAGLAFSDSSSLQKFYEDFDWYDPWISSSDFDNYIHMNSYETKNLYRILRYETAQGYRAQEYADAYSRLKKFINQCDSSLFGASDFAGFDQDMCRLARNGIYAKSGRIFDNEYLTAFYEEEFTWYRPTLDAADFDRNTGLLNRYQRDNLEAIIAFESAQGYG